jgi:formylglycine-generating enzyme required for sulfatase activity
VRGGAWDDLSDGCRAGYRFTLTAGVRDDSLGFRLVCCPIQEP